MDTLVQDFPVSMNRFKFNHGSISAFSNQNPHDGFKPNTDSFNPHPRTTTDSSSSSSSLGSNPEGDYPSNTAVLKYINDILMEEDMDCKTCMLQDCLALQAAEKSLYDVIGEQYPPPSGQSSRCFDSNVDSPDDNFTPTSSVDSSGNSTIIDCFLEPNWVFDGPKFESSYLQNSVADSPSSTLVEPGLFSDMQLARVGMGNNGSKSQSNIGSVVLASSEKLVADSSRGRKNHQRGDRDYFEEERSSKHSAFSLEEAEPSDMFDSVLLDIGGVATCVCHEDSQNGPSGKLQQQNGQTKVSNGSTKRTKKRGNKGELVDLWTILTQCAQAVASYDQRSATELLKQIRQHSSAFGDGTERLAHYFADGLEARLAGTGAPIYMPLVGNRVSAAEILKAYKVYVKACPFKRMSNFFANRTIRKKVMEEKATRLHIIDFGIAYGFQWPCLIQRLSEMPGGPPMLRITGIEFPQPGFRPAERVEETGRRVEKYCKRFSVPFEYSVIAKKWETIRYEDLKIDLDEMTVVNCLYRLKNLPDDTLVVNSARDAVLKLVRRINPVLFIHGVVNGTYNAPFFLTRFREALFHFSSLFDMFEACIPREEEDRMTFEKEIFAKDALNVIACEGIERVERPETYKQWHARNLRNGFRQLPLDQKILDTVKSTVKSEYHKDFVIDEDGQWMLQGWKGRIIYALSVWKPVEE